MKYDSVMIVGVAWNLKYFKLFVESKEYQSKMALIGESLGLETKSTKTLCLVQVSYKILEVVSSRMKFIQTVSSRLLQFYPVLSQSRPDLDV